jgi:hypothetical protein
MRSTCRAALLAALVATGSAESRAAAPDAEIEAFLLAAEVTAVEEIGTGVTRPRRLTLADGLRTARAAWKDVNRQFARRDTGSPRRDVLYFSDRWQHEIAAYRVDRLLGLGLVPVTVERALRGRPGSAQAWVEGAHTERERVERAIPLGDPAAYARSSELMAVFDALIYNTDRTQENILLTEPGSRMWLIDHSRAFALRPGLPPLERGRPAMAPALVERLRELDRERLDGALRGLLTRGQIRAILARRDRLLRGLDDER